MPGWRQSLRALLPGQTPARRAGPREEIEIRPAGESDLSAIAALLHEGDSHHRPYDSRAIRQEEPTPADPDVLRAWLGDPATVVLMAQNPATQDPAGEAGAALGFLRAVVQERPATRLRHALKAVVIEELVVTEAARGLGTGTRLMDEAQAWARERGADRVELGVYDANEAALTLYRKQGYRTLIRTLVRDL